MNELPWPVRVDYESGKFADEIKTGVTFARIVISRGCHGACAFCTTRALYDDESRRIVRSPLSVVNEMEYLIKEFGVKQIRFSDEVIYEVTEKSFKWLQELAALMKEI